jgi:hypothetical protein
MASEAVASREPESAATLILQIPLGARQVTMKHAGAEGVRTRWFVEGAHGPVITVHRHAQLEEAAALATVAMGHCQSDFAGVYRALDETVIRWRRGIPGFQPRSPAVRQEVSTLAHRITQAAMGYAEIILWCRTQGVTVTPPTPAEWLDHAIHDRGSDQANGLSLAESVAERGRSLARVTLAG